MEKRKGDAVKHRQCIENFWEEEFSNRHLGGAAYYRLEHKCCDAASINVAMRHCVR